jgi:DNA recombination protein RmuC
VLSALLLAVAWLAWRVSRLGADVRRVAEAPSGALQMLQREVQSVRSGVDEWLGRHLDHTQELSERLGQLQRATRDVERVGDELAELQRILRPPQLRGAFGERLLEDLLADALPRESFRIQHTYRATGARVDAAVLLGDGRVLPIDSKFPLDNFRRWVELRQEGSEEAESARRAFARDVRGHVDDVAERYLSPDDGALEVAFMYIPSEAVFHEVALWRPENGEATLAQYAHRRRVVPVSPNTLHAYLTVVRMGIRGFRLQEDAREILQGLEQLGRDLEVVRSELDTAASQARYSLGNLEDAGRALGRVEDRLASLGRSG